MIKLAVYNRDGKEVDSLKINESDFGCRVNHELLKQAIVMYHDNRRVGTAATKGRSMVAGSTKKLFRQKGTGNARIGNIRTGKRVGGGVTFAKISRDFSKRMPKKQKKLAANSAVLEKLLNNNIVVVDELGMDEPKTKEFAVILNNLKIDRSCLVMIGAPDDNLYKSARNIPNVAVMPISELNAGQVCSHNKLLITKEVFLSFLGKEKNKEN